MAQEPGAPQAPEMPLREQLADLAERDELAEQIAAVLATIPRVRVRGAQRLSHDEWIAWVLASIATSRSARGG